MAANPAPVKLVTFTANKEAQTAVLNWSTAEEVNSERFEVEHSLNGKQWRTIGTVAAKGNSQSTLWYSFVDADPANGENLYRLRMVDKDRTHAYSPVRSLSFDIKVGTYLYPNPVAEKLLINIDDWNKVERVQVYSNSGKAVYEAQSAPVDGIDVKNLPAGLYVVRVTRTNGAVEAYKVVKN
ncbi:T9SS type A sorting domain-containing protein [Rhabdobacter roseus]|uniref:T9SS type A sorting domain-containing protein n=1 Tax=Rhabdobacter roseus TaxID=1655419 RepID=UPI00160E56DF